MGKNKPIQFTIEIIPHSSHYFLNGTEIEKIYDLINVQEGPIRVYNGCPFSDILVIKKEKNKYIFYVDTLAQTNRERVEKISEELIETFQEDGVLLYDLINKKEIYNYRTKITEGDWRLFTKKEDWSTILCMDSMNTTPIKLYNAQNKHTLFWGIYYINNFLTNPFNMLVEEFGVDIMLNLIADVFNLKRHQTYVNSKPDIIPAIEIFSEDNTDIDKELLVNFNSVFQEQIKKEEEKTTEKKEKETGQILLHKGVVHLSDVLNKPIPYDEFIPLEVDIVTDPRVSSVHIEDGMVYFATAIPLEERTKNRLKDLFSEENRKFVVVETASKLENQLQLKDQFAWYKEIHNIGGIN